MDIRGKVAERHWLKALAYKRFAGSLMKRYGVPFDRFDEVFSDVCLDLLIIASRKYNPKLSSFMYYVGRFLKLYILEWLRNHKKTLPLTIELKVKDTQTNDKFEWLQNIPEYHLVKRKTLKNMYLMYVGLAYPQKDKIYNLRFLNQLEYSAIARKLGVTKQAVHQRLLRFPVITIQQYVEKLNADYRIWSQE